MEIGKQYKLQRVGNQLSACFGLTLEGEEGYLGGELEMNFSLICQALLHLGPCLSQGSATGRGLLDCKMWGSKDSGPKLVLRREGSSRLHISWRYRTFKIVGLNNETRLSHQGQGKPALFLDLRQQEISQ